jgi:hypothetical protein
MAGKRILRVQAIVVAGTMRSQFSCAKARWPCADQASGLRPHPLSPGLTHTESIRTLNIDHGMSWDAIQRDLDDLRTFTAVAAQWL